MSNGRKLSRMGKMGFCLWARETLTGVGLSFGMAFLMILLGGFSTEKFGHSENMAEVILGIFPYYLMFAGIFVLMVISIGWFQNAFSILVSVNVTRRHAVRGIFLSLFCFMAVELGAIALIWKVTPGDVARDGMKLIWLFVGAFLILGALCAILGAVSLKWGKGGLIVMLLVGLAGGGIVGFCVAVSDKTMVELMQSCIGRNYAPVAAAGALVFLLADILVQSILRKIEVRR